MFLKTFIHEPKCHVGSCVEANGNQIFLSVLSNGILLINVFGKFQVEIHKTPLSLPFFSLFVHK